MKKVGLFSVVSFRIINCDFLQQLDQLSLPSLNVFRGCNNFISLFLTLQDKFGISARPINQSINHSSLLLYARHVCPVARARGSCLKRKTIKLSMSKNYMKYIKSKNYLYC